MTPRTALWVALTLSTIACAEDPEVTATDTSGSDPQTGSTTSEASTTTGVTGDTDMLLTSSSASSGSDPTLLSRTVEAMGGETAILDLRSLRYSLEGRVDAHSETSDPNVGQPRLQHGIAAEVSYDIDDEMLRYEYVRNLEIVGTVVTQSEVFADDRGTFLGADIVGVPAGVMTADRVASTLRQQQWLTPATLIADVLQGTRGWHGDGSTRFDGVDVDVLRVDDEVSPIDLYIGMDGTLLGLRVMENDMLLRDVETTVRYEDWRDVAQGPRVPYDVTIAVDGYPVREETRADIEANVDFEAATFAEAQALAGPIDAALFDLGTRTPHGYQMIPARISDGRPSFLMPEPLAPGVTVLRGTFHNTIVVEQEAGLVVIEAGGYPERSAALLAWVEATYPDMDITTLAVTHHHYDVVAGVRGALASGATLLASARAQEFWARVLGAESTIVPDAFAQLERTAQVQWVPDGASTMLPDRTHPIQAHHVVARHAEDSLIYWLPAQDLVVVTDLYSPGFPFITEETIHGAQDFNTLLLELEIPETTRIVTGVGFGTPTVAEFREEFNL
ncbi:MAG: MBL fold metallo-hydrolase [Nannocystales bacterium]